MPLHLTIPGREALDLEVLLLVAVARRTESVSADPTSLLLAADRAVTA